MTRFKCCHSQLVLMFCVCLGLVPAASLQAQNNPNPNYFYLVKGEPIARGITLGDDQLAHHHTQRR